jgi:hypothetical protein
MGILWGCRRLLGLMADERVAGIDLAKLSEAIQTVFPGRK